MNLDHLKPLAVGSGIVEARKHAGNLVLAPSSSGYSNAQLDDHGDSPRNSLAWQPPVHLRVRARASRSEPIGTLGFGFWNNPFSTAVGQPGASLQLPAAPEAVWFFYSSGHSVFRFREGIPTHGWKAMCLTTPSIPGPILAPAALTALLLSRIPVIRRPVMDLVLRQVTADEEIVGEPIEQWHIYEIDWKADRVEFRVDGQVILRADISVMGPLGFVTWIDNQFAIASIVEGLRFGTVIPHGRQSLELADLSITGNHSDQPNGYDERASGE